MTAYDPDLEIATAAARDAGAAVMRHFRAPSYVRYKGPEQPLTEADLEADAILRRVLTGERPTYGWLSEETTDTRARLQRRRVWVVDPIDGTNSFVEGYGEFAVSVGLVEDGVPVIGVVYNPATGELYRAARGAGASRNGVVLRPRSGPPATLPVLLASRAELAAGEFDGYAEGWRIVAMGSTAYRMCKVADATGHLFFTRKRRSEWDVCAASLILSEAGGLATQVDGSPMRFNQRDPAVRGIVARGGGWVPLPDARAPEKPEDQA